MFEYLAFRLGLWRLERGRKKNDAANEKTLSKLKSDNAKYEAIYEAEERAHYEGRLYDEDAYRLHARYLFAEARRLIIPTSKFHSNDAWEEGPSGRRHLKVEALNELRGAVRQEKRLRRETVLMWLPAIAATTGLLGALIGVVSVWKGLPTTK